MFRGNSFLNKEKTILKSKIKESLASVLPITFIVLALCFTVAPISSGTLLAFIAGAVLLVIGMGLFTLGSEMSMTYMGEYVGAKMTRSRNIVLIAIISFFVGVMITISEPDLQVLAEQVPGVENMVLILSVAFGVGIFLVMGMLRIIFGIKLKYMLIVSYILVFALTFFVPKSFLAVAFDSGGVTTGPMTVPFIIALGVGVAAIRSDSNAENDSFGLVALSSVGPILAVMILGMIYQPSDVATENFAELSIANSKELQHLFMHEMPHYMSEVAIAIAPIAIFFFIFQLIAGCITKENFVKILIGLVYTYFGLVLFLTGVNVGFMPVGSLMGSLMGRLEYKWIVVPLGILMGYFVVRAEPAVHILAKQVEDVTAGAIPQNVLYTTLSIGVSASVGLAMLRVITGISILYFIVPGYVISLILTFFVPDIFTSIAFDSGGVASGPMTATFLLAFAMGACEAVGGNIVTDAFGVVAMVAMTPLIAIQVLGLIYKIRVAKAAVDTVEDEVAAIEVTTAEDDDIISF